MSSQLDAAVQEIKGVEGVGQVEGIKCDVSQISQVEELREKVLDLFGEVSLLLERRTTVWSTPYLPPILLIITFFPLILTLEHWENSC